MSAIVGIGATHELEGFGLAGVRVVAAATDADVRDAWSGLGDDVGLVVLSREAADVLGPLLVTRPWTLTVVMP